MKRPASNLMRTFGAPLAIAVVSLIGLVAALAGDGLADVVSWVGLSVPVAVIVWARIARRG